MHWLCNENTVKLFFSIPNKNTSTDSEACDCIYESVVPALNNLYDMILEICMYSSEIKKKRKKKKKKKVMDVPSIELCQS